MNRALVLDTYIRTISQSISKPEDERHLTFDLHAYNQEDFELAINTSDGNNADSQRMIPAITTFVQIYAPYPIELTLNGVLVLPAYKGLFLLSAPLSSLRLRNLSTSDSVVCSAIFA